MRRITYAKNYRWFFLIQNHRSHQGKLKGQFHIQRWNHRQEVWHGFSA